MKNYARISCTSRYVPENCVTNHQLSEMMDTSDEWIHSRTGISERRIVTQENTSDLCHQVAKQLLEKSGKQASEIDFYFSCNSDTRFQYAFCFLPSARRNWRH